MKKILYCLMLVLGCSALLLTSCEKKSNSEVTDPTISLTGTSWKGKGLSTTITMTFDTDTTASISLSGMFGGTISGTYTHEGEQITLHVTSSSGAVAAFCEPGDDIDGVYTGSTITITIMEVDYTLDKQ